MFKVAALICQKFKVGVSFLLECSSLQRSFSNLTSTMIKVGLFLVFLFWEQSYKNEFISIVCDCQASKDFSKIYAYAAAYYIGLPFPINIGLG